ncbi:TPA: PQQ-like beta-propeller repeat protein [Bacillus thuringiensis]|nr:PQQ-like beta-propeller repeat protein [Bacillus thuringiensis]
MKKKFMLMMLLFALMVGLYPHSMTKAENINTQGEQFEQGKYDLQAGFPFGQNWNRNSPYAGTDTNKIKWEYKLYEKDIKEIPTSLHTPSFTVQPAIGRDGTIYITNKTALNNTVNKKIHALNPNGSLKWKKEIMGGGSSTPVIAEDGTIYVAARNLIAFNPDGSIKWQVNASSIDTPVLDHDGTIYLKGSNRLYAYNPDGSIKWSSNEIKDGSGETNSMLISKDGIIYTLVSDLGNKYIYAHDKNGRQLWEKYVRGEYNGTGFTLGIRNEILVNTQDILYVFDKAGNIVHQLKEEGREALLSAPTVSSKDGTIYVGGKGYIYAYNPDYSLKWKYQTKGDVIEAPLIDKNGEIYFRTNNEVYVLKPDATLKWKMAQSKTWFVPGKATNSITMGQDGSLYILGKYLSSNGSEDYTSLIAIGDSYTDNVCTKDSTYMEVLKSLEAKSKNAKLTDEEKKEARDILKKLSDDLDKTDK